MDKRQAFNNEQMDKSKSFTRFSIRFGRFCLYAFVALILIILLIFSAVSLYLYKNPQELSQSLAKEIMQLSGVQASFETVDVTLLPLPALALSNVVLKYEDIELNIAYVTASPRLINLIQGKFTLGHVSLLRPYIIGEFNPEQTNISKQKVSAESTLPTTQAEAESANSTKPFNVSDFLNDINSNLPIPSMLFGTNFNILHGLVNVKIGDTHFHIEDLQSEISVNRRGDVEFNVSLGPSSIFNNNEIILKSSALQLGISGLSADSQQSDFALNLNTRLSIANVIEQTNIALQFNLTPRITPTESEDYLPNISYYSTGNFNFSGNLSWNEALIPFDLRGSITGDIEQDIMLKDVFARLDSDELKLNANISNMLSPEPTATGQIDLKKLNLTQWFGFARNLPPGLQQALQNIGNGKLQFEMDKTGLRVPSIQATAVDANFIGTGSVESWDNIIIKLDLHAESVALIKAFPESEGVEVQTPRFSHDPLTPVPGSVEAQSMTGPSVGYDINLGVNTLTTWNLTIEDVKFKCIPTEQDVKSNPKNHPNAVLLDFGIGKFYGGKGSAKLILFRTEDARSGYDITAILRNVRAEGPLNILAGREVFGGRLSLDTSFITYGKNLGEFLIAKKGQLTLRTDKGYFTSKDKNRTTFDKFTVAAKFEAKPLTKKMINRMPELLRFNGIWKSTLERNDLLSELNLNGIITLVGRNYVDLVLNGTPGTLQLALQPELTGAKQELYTDLKGKFFFDSVKETFGITDLTGSIPNLANTQLSGDIKLNYVNDMQWEAQLESSTNNFPKLLERLNPDTKASTLDNTPQKLKMQAKITKNSKKLSISDLKFSLDDMKGSGSIVKSIAKTPSWDIKLNFELLDLDRLLASDNKKSGASTTTSPSPPTPVSSVKGKPWSLAWLKENNAKGSINIEALRFEKTLSTNVHIPINMNNGTLRLSPITGTFYRSPATVDFVGRAINDELHVQGGIRAEQINMMLLSQELKLETIIAGSGSVWASVQGTLLNSDNILSALDGTWRIKIIHGYLQSRNEDGTLDKDQTKIDILEDSGPLSKGILYSKNLTMQGPDMSLKGSGNVNLLNDTLDMELIVSTGGLNDIPVRYYGSLEDPERDIHTGSVIVGAISSLGLGFFDLIGGTLKGIFSIFQ